MRIKQRGGLVVLIAAAITLSSCSFAFKQPAAVSTSSTTAPPGPAGPAGPGGPQSGGGKRDGTSTSTTEAPTTTDIYSGKSVSEIDKLVIKTNEELCAQIDDVVITGSKIANYGSTYQSETKVLKSKDIAKVRAEINEFRTKARELLAKLTNLGELADPKGLAEQLETFGKSIDQAGNDVDLRPYFLSYMSSSSTTLQFELKQVAMTRCPESILVQLDQ